ncbi:endonuclease MutS2 [Chamaesiphon minutus]|uniref:Endonuclease MutS2 n=1 Tax=Chamaesiphon minutus (strain ATCC 27169 / PCC 6605) TaxID=1173020 RepID=K9UCG4_CHAP6|nr:endonuclease MutS2 [Chamaesiphon minutus]AFY91904.1 MutS2 family protein [Chamaesiphon minutus PCC 6605]
MTIQAETLELLEWSRLCQQVATFAATKLGTIAARNLVIPQSPSVSLNLLAQTKEVYDLETRLTGGLSLDGIEDFGDALERAAVQGMLSGKELHEIATTLAGMRKLRRTIDSEENIPVLQGLVADVRTYPELEQDIYHCIDDRGDVTDRSSEKLAQVRVQLKGLRDRIYKFLNSLIQRQSNAIQQPLITQRGDRFVIPVKASHKDAIPGVVHDSSGSGSTLYVEPQQIINLGNQLRQLQRQEQREIEAVLMALTAKVTEVVEDLEHLLVVATTIDLATAKARYSLWLEANPPRFVDRAASEYITLRQLRHPLLIWKHRHEEGSPVVPIDLSIRPDIRVVTITGPNTGGKTVTLKTLAIVALMAKVGLFIPAREPVEIPWFDLILADIGDEQSLQQSLSTFSGHIRRIGRILDAIGEEGGERGAGSTSTTLSVSGGDEEMGSVRDDEETIDLQVSHSPIHPSTPSSLILLDEVGAGTDPAEGSALAIALLQYLADRAMLTIASTHYGELKALKYQDSRFENASVEFDDVNLAPTYRLLWGIPGRSNALSIAQRLGLNPEVIENAKSQVILGATQEVNEVIAGLEAQRRTQETKASEAANVLKQAEAFYLEVSQKAAQLQAREQELKVNQERAVQAAIAEAKGEIAQVIRQLQQGPQTAQAAQQATSELDGVSSRRLPAKSTPKPPVGFNPKVGDRIRIPKIGQKAEVLSEVDDNGNLNVKFGIMKMNVALADIESLTGEKATPPPKKSGAKVPGTAAPAAPPVAIRTSTNTVDVRGQRVMNAETEIERAIGRAYQSGIMWVIHGKGTGKLREGVHEFLSHHPQVLRFELAGEKDGGGGVTIAYLK